MWYDAVVVAYYPETNEYKIVYRSDDGVELAPLHNRRWILAPKKRPFNGIPVLDGAIVEFEYPHDGERYLAMVYDYTHRGERLKVVYIDEHTTDKLKGGGWEFIKGSPCLDESPEETPVSESGVHSQAENDYAGTYDVLANDQGEEEIELEEEPVTATVSRRTRSGTTAVATAKAAAGSKSKVAAISKAKDAAIPGDRLVKPLKRAHSKSMQSQMRKLKTKPASKAKSKVATKIAGRVTRSSSGGAELRSSTRLRNVGKRSAPR